MVTVVAPMGRQIKGDGQSLLSSGHVLAIKGIAGFGRTESSILPNGPWSMRIHGSIWASFVRKDAWQFWVLIGANIPIDGLNGDSFRRHSLGS